MYGLQLRPGVQLLLYLPQHPVERVAERQRIAYSVARELFALEKPGQRTAQLGLGAYAHHVPEALDFGVGNGEIRGHLRDILSGEQALAGVEQPVHQDVARPPVSLPEPAYAVRSPNQRRREFEVCYAVQHGLDIVSSDGNEYLLLRAAQEQGIFRYSRRHSSTERFSLSLASGKAYEQQIAITREEGVTPCHELTRLRVFPAALDVVEKECAA